ncbi:MAG: DUF429 domain-containing protein [Fimbriimonas sp.]|nr:DUF429 domain-containing protein [Fimbriimonas sp.]
MLLHPDHEPAKAHPTNYFGWMINGASLFNQIEVIHPLLVDPNVDIGGPICLETFPHAAARALAGEVVLAKQKRKARGCLLERAGIDVSQLANIDEVDAALCALVAHRFLVGDIKTYGESGTGFIVVPGTPLPSIGAIVDGRFVNQNQCLYLSIRAVAMPLRPPLQGGVCAVTGSQG